MDADLLQQLKAAAKAVFPPRGVLAAYVHGSRVSGRPRPESDLDVGYYLSGYLRGETLPIKEEMVMAADLSDAVGLGVDLRNLGEATLEMRGQVLEDGVRIFSGDDVARVGLERDLLGRYHDYKEEFRLMHELRLKRITERGI
jgi:predicted nucleotidyltransferase